MMKPREFPGDLYLVRYPDGTAHWFDSDPMKMTDKEKKEKSFDIEDILFGEFGTGGVDNPLRVRLGCALSSRCEDLNARNVVVVMKENRSPGAKRSGARRRFMDLEGNMIDIFSLSAKTEPEYPISGSVINRDGEVTDNRTYTMDGRCSDGIWSHTIVIRTLPAERRD